MSKRLNTTNLLTIVSVTVLVGIEILGAALAAGWALGGLFQLGKQVTTGIVVLSLALGGWATWKFIQSALRVEPITK